MKLDKRNVHDRVSLLADVAEMYYLEEKNQAEIAKSVGVTRSMISRMLTEARESGIVEIRIQRPLQSDSDLESELKEKFGLKDVFVVVTHHHSGSERLTRTLGSAGAQMLARYLAPQKDPGPGLGHIHQRNGGCLRSHRTDSGQVWFNWLAPWARIT